MKLLVATVGFEPTTFALSRRYSDQLSYAAKKFGAPGGNRTPTLSKQILSLPCLPIPPLGLCSLVPMTGFEPVFLLWNNVLNVARLPISPHRHFKWEINSHWLLGKKVTNPLEFTLLGALLQNMHHLHL